MVFALGIILIMHFYFLASVGVVKTEILGISCGKWDIYTFRFE
jgi:hypothetical protein